MKTIIKTLNLLIIFCAIFSLTAGQRKLTTKQRTYVKSRAAQIDCDECCKEGQAVTAECCAACNGCMLKDDRGRSACRDIPTMSR